MARIRGAVPVTSSYEINTKKPFDARMLVPTYEDLLLKDNWVKSGTTIPTVFNGLFVAVANTSDISKNGLYFLFDPNAVAPKSPDPTIESNWIKFADINELEDVISRISNIETELDDIKDRLDALESDSDVETYGYRSGFPVTGEANKLYVAADEQKSYVWVNNDYLPVGGSDYIEPSVIYGGDSGIE